MKHLFLFIGFTFNILSAQAVNDTLQDKSEQSLLRFRLRINLLKEDSSLYFYSDAVLHVKLREMNAAPAVLNSIDEFLIRNCFEKGNIDKADEILLASEMRRDGLLRAYRLQQKPGYPTVEAIQKYLGLANKVGGFVLLAIFLAK